MSSSIGGNLIGGAKGFEYKILLVQEIAPNKSKRILLSSLNIGNKLILICFVKFVNHAGNVLWARVKIEMAKAKAV